MTQSEYLTKNAAKIDFSKKTATEIDVKKEKKEDEKEAEDQQSSWPFASIRDKLKSAYTEVCVLRDVLSIAKNKTYMVLDPVPQGNLLILYVILIKIKQ